VKSEIAYVSVMDYHYAIVINYRSGHAETKVQ